MKKLVILSVFMISGLILFAQQPIKTETLNWCKCDPNTISNPELRKTSECERIFYDTVVYQLMLSLHEITTEKGINGFFASEILPGESITIESIGTDQSSLPFNIGDFAPIPPPSIRWIPDGDSEFSKDLYHKLDSLSKILGKSTMNGTWTAGLNDQIMLKISELQNKTYVLLTINTNRNFEQKVYGSKVPVLLTGTNATQAFRIPFSLNLEAIKSTGLKGTTAHETVLLYGAYKPVKINWSGEDLANIVRIELNIQQGQPLLNLYGVELRFEGNQEIIDQMIKLIDYQRIKNAILRY